MKEIQPRTFTAASMCIANKGSKLRQSLACSPGMDWAGGAGAQEECSSRGPPGISVFCSGRCLYLMCPFSGAQAV